MKKIISTTLLFFFCINSYSQNIITVSLKNKIESSQEDDFIPIIIEINNTLKLKDIKEEFDNNNIAIKKRASILASRLQESARFTQENVINFIKNNSSKYKNLYPFWITNCIYVELAKDLIPNLLLIENVRKIDLENGFFQKIESSKEINNTICLDENGVEPGIEAINVRPLWEMGYTGRGRLVFNYDTGVWPTHPAFSERFFANFYPMEQCWDGYFNPEPNGINDHGTHTLGIMCGLVKETNDTIGAAFKSYWIANDFVTSTVEELPPVVDMITSFEWAFNPDGDLSTDFDVPDVINNSWRWYNPIDNEQCEGYVVDLMNAIETAGIGNIFSAGNDGPSNEGVKAPQRINSSLVNTFCVASVNANDDNLNISTFSTRGPTQCPSEEGGSLEIYPEVSAPGQSVRSASGENGFDVKSGTSMAAPHVTGAFLLLKEAFPFISGENILLALYYTATDLGDVGEDNTYGMGIINAFAAFNYLCEIYEPIIPNNTEDISLREIENIPNKITCLNSFTPTIFIENNGLNSIDGINVFIESESINIGPIFFNESLDEGQEISITLPSITDYDIGDHEICFRVEPVSNTIEYDYHNNRKMVRFKYKPSFNLPYYEDFESGVNPNLWHIYNDDLDRTWNSISTTGIINSNTSAYVNLFGYNPRDEQKDELISSAINLQGDFIEMKFYTSYQKYNNSSKQDTLQVYLSNNCGFSFDYMIFEKGGEELETFNQITADFIPSEAIHWREEIIQLDDFQNQEILLKFVTTNLRGNNIFIDNIEITNNLTYTDQYTNNIILYPNPSKGTFMINCLECNNEEIIIIVRDLLGNIISHKTSHNKRSQIEFKHQKNGVYLLEIENGNMKKIFPIIKI